jgi:hypothetical protein
MHAEPKATRMPALPHSNKINIYTQEMPKRGPAPLSPRTLPIKL